MNNTNCPAKWSSGIPRCKILNLFQNRRAECWACCLFERHSLCFEESPPDEEKINEGLKNLEEKMLQYLKDCRESNMPLSRETFDWDSEICNRPFMAKFKQSRYTCDSDILLARLKAIPNFLEKVLAHANWARGDLYSGLRCNISLSTLILMLTAPTHNATPIEFKKFTASVVSDGIMDMINPLVNRANLFPPEIVQFFDRSGKHTNSKSLRHPAALLGNCWGHDFGGLELPELSKRARKQIISLLKSNMNEEEELSIGMNISGRKILEYLAKVFDDEESKNQVYDVGDIFCSYLCDYLQLIFSSTDNVVSILSFHLEETRTILKQVHSEISDSDIDHALEGLMDMFYYPFLWVQAIRARLMGDIAAYKHYIERIFDSFQEDVSRGTISPVIFIEHVMQLDLIEKYVPLGEEENDHTIKKKKEKEEEQRSFFLSKRRKKRMSNI